MPEISIDKVSGEQQNWASFFEIFNAVISCNKDLADVQKLIYLKSYLVGEPLKLVESLSLIGTNLHVAINILKERYENKLATIYNHIQGLMEISSLSRWTSSSLRDFVVNVKQHTECLKNLNVPIQHWDFILVFILSHKLDVNTRRSYELERGPTNMPTLIDFLNFVEKRCQAAENLSGSESVQKVTGNKYSHLAQEQISSRVSCVYCKMSNHAIAKCFKFKSLTVAHRRRFVYDNRLCFKCFSPHNASQCKLNNCSICKQPHHLLLHYEKCSSGEASGDQSNYQSLERENKN